MFECFCFIKDLEALSGQGPKWVEIKTLTMEKKNQSKQNTVFTVLMDFVQHTNHNYTYILLIYPASLNTEYCK